MKMRQKHVSLAVLAGLLVVLGSEHAAAQHVRPERTVFLRPTTGIVGYLGDNNRSLVSFADPFPFSIGLEAGYQFSGPLSLSAGYMASKDVRVTNLTKTDLRHTIDVTGRYTFGGPTGLAPYVQLGAFTSSGQVPSGSETERRMAYGPLAGVGLDLPVSNRVSLFLETNLRAAFPDDAMDGFDGGGFGNFDLHTSMATGFRFNLRSAVVPVHIWSVSAPDELVVGDEGHFSAIVNDDRATKPLSFQWDFGDGSRATATSADHRFTQPGTYTARFTASNRGGSATESVTVRVMPAAVPPTILGITADPASPDTHTPVRFRAEARGDAPLRYAWNFGDGATSQDAAPLHQFEEVGSYQVSLSVENAAGRDERSITVRVRPYEAEICSEVFDMNTALFEQNSSQLTAAARRVLTDNAKILLECPNMNARLVGHAAPNERQPQLLSEDRARAVEEFYVEQGISATRLDVVGRGVSTSMTSKKEGAEQYRRVDTLPLR